MFFARWFGAAALSLAVSASPLWLVACGKRPDEHSGGFPPPPVSVAEVVVREVVPWNEFHGRIEAAEFVELRPRVGGVIEDVRYREGDFVNKGDLLFVLDQSPFQAELERAEAELARSLAQEQLSRLEQQRAVTLFERKLISEDEYEQRSSAQAQAVANVRAAEAAVQLARLDLNYTKIRSPIAGRTGRALFTKGNLVASDPTPDVLTTIVSLDPVYVYFDSDELTYLRYSSSARPPKGNGEAGKAPIVHASVGNEQGYPRRGYVDFIDNQIDPRTGTIRLRALLENKDHSLTPGQFARIRLLQDVPVQAVLIDDKAILTDQDRKYVYVLGPDNHAVRRNIEIGRIYDGLRNVTSGLAPGDRVIVHGVQKVFFPGMPVTPQSINMGDPLPVSGPGPTDGH